MLSESHWCDAIYHTSCLLFSKEYFDVERRQERSVEETTTPRRWHKRTQLERRLGVFQSLTRNQFIFFISKQKHFLSSLKFLILFQSVFLLWLQKCGGTRTHTHTAPMEDCKNIRPKKKFGKKSPLLVPSGRFFAKKVPKKGFFFIKNCLRFLSKLQQTKEMISLYLLNEWTKKNYA